MRYSIVLLLLLAAPWTKAATVIDGRPNNPYGVMLGLGGSDHSDFVSFHLQQARDMIGEWGHVRIDSGIHADFLVAERALAMCRAKKLTPVMTGLYVPEEYRRPNAHLLDAAPYVRDDGYPLAAARYRAWAAAFKALGAWPPYYEVGNEINGKWEPAAYGRFIIAVSAALKEELPAMGVVSAGLAGYGGNFLAEMIRAVPQSAAAIDFYGLHPYGANHPPAYDEDPYCLRGHQFTARDLASVGVANPRFVMTESGYELGNKRDPRYPRITDALRARYLVEAYRDIWAHDPSVVTLTLFMLQATNYPGWHGWVLLNDDCTPNETYKALAAVPKPAGSDWMPAGPGVISGRIGDAESGLPVERVFVYTVPGLYAAETDRAGEYTIAGLPPGSYEVRMFRDGFTPPERQRLTVIADQPVRYDAAVSRVGLIDGDFDAGESVAAGWTPDEAPETMGNHYQVDRAVKRSGAASQRLAARPGDPVAVWVCSAYASAVPDTAYAAEVWVKGRGVQRGAGAGAQLSLAITDSGAQPLSETRVGLPPAIEGDFDWTPLSVTLPPFARGRRLVVKCFFDAVAGEVWFDDAYLHYADFPVPSRGAGSGSGVLRGEVMTQKDEERLPDATVWLRPGNYWTQTASDGRYVLTGIPAGVYDLHAYAPGWRGAPAYQVEIGAGAALVHDFFLLQPPAPREVQNPGFELSGLEMAYTPGWMSYGEFDGLPENGWHPEVPGFPDGFHARSGRRFAGSITGSNVKNGGIYQVLEVTPETTYEAGVWMYTYQTEEGHRGDAVSRLGLDPMGGTDPHGPYVIWTPYRPSHLVWSRVTLKAKANTNRMTLFLDYRQVSGLTYLLNLFDDVTFEEAAEDLPEPQRLPVGVGNLPRRQ